MASARELRELDEAEQRLREKLEQQLQELEEKRKAVAGERLRSLGDTLQRAGVLVLDDAVIAGGVLHLVEKARRADAGDPDAAKLVEAWKAEGARFLPKQETVGAGKKRGRRPKEAGAHAGSAAPGAEPAAATPQRGEGPGVGAEPAGADA